MQRSALAFKKTTNANGKREYQKYYMRIYEASDEKKKAYRELLHDVVKLTIERDNLMAQVSASDRAEAPVKTDSDKLVATIIITTEDETKLPKITVKPKEKILEPLIPFYAKFAREFHQKYRSSVNYGIVERLVRIYQTKTVEQLEEAKQFLQNDKMRFLVHRIYQEGEKAAKVLRERFGHPDIRVELKMLEPMRATVEAREQLWVNGMLALRAEGFSFFEAKLASDHLAFPLGKPDDPYIYYDENPLFERHAHTLKTWNNPQIVEWKRSEAEDMENKTEVWTEYWKQVREREHREAKFRKALREYLINYIQIGHTKDDLLVECERAKYSPTQTATALEMWKDLRKEGFRSKVPIRINMQVVEQDAFTTKFDETARALIQAGLTDEEIIARFRSDPELGKIDGPNLDLWMGRLRQIRSAIKT